MIKITIKVKPNSKESTVEETGHLQYTVRVKAPAVDGKANKAVIEALSDHFNIAKSRINIKSGAGSKSKMVLIS